MVLSNRLSAEEREVHIWLDDVDRKWKAEASIGKYITKFRKAGWIEVNTYYYDNGQVAISFFEAPERGITIRNPKKRIISDEERKMRSKIMKQTQAKINK